MLQHRRTYTCVFCLLSLLSAMLTISVIAMVSTFGTISAHTLPRTYTQQEVFTILQHLQSYPANGKQDSAYIHLLHQAGTALLGSSPQQAIFYAEEALRLTASYANEICRTRGGRWYAMSLLSKAHALRKLRLFDSAQALASYVLRQTHVYQSTPAVLQIQAQAYIAMGWILEDKQADRATERLYFSEALQLYERLGMVSEAGYAGTLKAITQMYMNDFSSAEQTLLTALQFCRQGNDTADIAYCLFTLADCAYIGGLHQENAIQKAITHYLQALSLYEQRKDTLFIGRIHTDIAVLYRDQRNLSRALESAKKGVTILQSPAFAQTFALAHAYIGLGNIYLERVQPDSAARSFLKALDIARWHPDKGLTGDVHQTLGKLYRNTREYPLSIHHLEKAMNIFHTMHDTSRYISAVGQYCLVLNAARYFEKAIHVAQDALTMTDSVRMKDAQAVLFRELSYAYEHIGKFQLAFSSLQKAVTLEREVLQEHNFQTLAEVHTRYETEKKDESLRQMAIVQEYQLQQLEQESLIRFLLILGLCSVGGGVFFVFRLYRKQRILTIEIEQQKSALEALNIELQHSNTFKTEILGIASHDLKNPLSAILLSAQIALQQDLEPMFRSLLQNIMSAGTHIQMLIERLIDMTGRELGKLHLNVHTFSVHDLFLGVIQRSENLLQHKHQHIILHNRVEEPCSGDLALLGQVLDNLVSNASKYSPRHSIITLSADIMTSPEHDGHVLTMTVSDQGQGMTPDDIERLGGMYQKLSAQPTQEETSSGIGLYIVKQIIELHGGCIRIDSAGKDCGTTFAFSIPHTKVQEQIA